MNIDIILILKIIAGVFFWIGLFNVVFFLVKATRNKFFLDKDKEKEVN